VRFHAPLHAGIIGTTDANDFVVKTNNMKL
jgi:hypothetical protein